MSLPNTQGEGRGADMHVLERVARSVVKVISRVWAYAYLAFIIASSVVAILCAVAVVAFIVLEGFAILTGNG